MFNISIASQIPVNVTVTIGGNGSERLEENNPTHPCPHTLLEVGTDLEIEVDRLFFCDVVS